MQKIGHFVEGRFTKFACFSFLVMISLLYFTSWYLHSGRSVLFVSIKGCAKHQDVTLWFHCEILRSSLEDVYRTEDYTSNGTAREKEGISVMIISFSAHTPIDALRIVHHYNQNLTVYKPREFRKTDSPCFLNRFHVSSRRSSIQTLNDLKSHLVALNTSFDSFQLRRGMLGRREVTNLSDVVGDYAINLCGEVPSYWLT